MKKSPYSPDKSMQSLYPALRAEPYKGIDNPADILTKSKEIAERTKVLLGTDKLGFASLTLKKIGEPLNYPEYTLQKYSVEIFEGLESAVFILKPKDIKGTAPATVALCGHGYGVRQILGISKKGNKKHLPYIDNYQKNFAAELARRGCIVAAPELFGFGEARLAKDLKKPFYISSCDELSHHLLPYGLTVAGMRVMQAIACAEILFKDPDADQNRLGIMGISGGGLTALYSSVIDSRFARTVVSGYVNTFRSSILSMWHCPDNYIPGILGVGEIYDFASSIAPRELLIESGTKDKLFPIDAANEAHEKIRHIYSLLDAEEKLTIDIFNGNHSVSGRKSFDFLSK